MLDLSAVAWIVSFWTRQDLCLPDLLLQRFVHLIAPSVDGGIAGEVTSRTPLSGCRAIR